jgi:hypothetical protein
MEAIAYEKASWSIGRHVAQSLFADGYAVRCLGTPLFEAEGYNVVAVKNWLTYVAKNWAKERSTVGTGSL